MTANLQQLESPSSAICVMSVMCSIENWNQTNTIYDTNIVHSLSSTYISIYLQSIVYYCCLFEFISVTFGDMLFFIAWLCHCFLFMYTARHEIFTTALHNSKFFSDAVRCCAYWGKSSHPFTTRSKWLMRVTTTGLTYASSNYYQPSYPSVYSLCSPLIKEN